MPDPTPNATQIDRSLVIVLTPTLVWQPNGGIGATIAYKQTESIPNMPNAVGNSGNITLSPWKKDARYTDNLDVFIFLDTSKCVDASGNAITVRWAQPNEGNHPNDFGCIWFCKTPLPGANKDTTQIAVPGMSTGRINDTLVYIDDNTPATTAASYTFCTAIVVPDRGNYYITIDPLIGGKGGTAK